MNYYAKPLNKLINELSRLPGIGGKTAQRLALHILSVDDREAFALADANTFTLTYTATVGTDTYRMVLHFTVTAD